MGGKPAPTMLRKSVFERTTMLHGSEFRVSASSWRAARLALGVATAVFLVLYSRSWPFPPLIQYARTEPIKIRGTWRDGSGLVAAQLVYQSNGQPVRDPFVRWEVRRLARGFIAGSNLSGGEVLARGAFVYKPCSASVAGQLWCRNYEWVWFVPTFLPRPDDLFPLETAVAARNTREIEALIHAGTNVNARGPRGETAIWSARTPEIARILVAAGANVEAPVDDGFTALMGAARAHDLEGAQALLAVGADPNARDGGGRTPLLHALHPPLFRQDVPSAALVGELLHAGAQVDARDREGFRPLMSAVRGGWPDIVRLLLAAHADPNARAREGATALSLALAADDPEMVQLLRRSGARE